MPIKDRIIYYCVNRPKTCLFIVILLLIPAIFGFTKLERVYSTRLWFRANDPYLQEYDRFTAVFGNDDTIGIGIYHPKTIMSQKGIQILEDLTQALWTAPHIIRVDSLTNYNHVSSVDDDIDITPLFLDQKLTPSFLKQTSALIKTIEEVNGYYINDQQNAAMIHGQFKPNITAYHFFKQAHVHMQKVIDKLKLKHPDYQFYLTGTSAVNIAINEATNNEASRTLPIAFAIIIFVLIVIFPYPKIIFAIACEILVALIFTIGLGAWMGIKITMIMSMVPCIILAIALSDTIHLVTSYRENSYDGFSPKKALEKALRKVFRPTILTTITTSVGFFSFTISDLAPLKDLGIVVGLGVFITWITSLFLAAPILALLPVSFRPPKNNKRWNGFGHYLPSIDRFRWPIVIALLIVSVLATSAAFQNEPNSNFLDFFNEETPIKKSHNFVKDNMRFSSGTSVIFKSGKTDGVKDPAFLKEVAATLEQFKQIPHIVKVNSILTVLERVHGVLHPKAPKGALPDTSQLAAQELLLYEMGLPPGQSMDFWINNDRSILRAEIIWDISNSKEILAIIDQLQNILDKSSVDGAVAGSAYLHMGLDRYILSTFKKSMAFTFVFVILLMIIIFKSLTLGLISMIPNLLPPIWGLGLLYLKGQSLDVGVVLIVSVCLGIAVDDTIYFLDRFQVSRKKGGTMQEILTRVLNDAGKSLWFTTIILVFGFASLAISDFQPNQNFGVLTALVLALALACDLIGLPATLLAITDLKKKLRKKA
jgi:predicted RND superfamily exporter protein